MPSDEPTLENQGPVQSDSRNHVVVTGAGFTRALVPDAPLLVDDFKNEALEDKVRGLPRASRLLHWERKLHKKGYINIERLMTRLDSLMPYDYAEIAGNATNEYAFLLSELKRGFLNRIQEMREGCRHLEELQAFAKHCVDNGYCCITFNYDDILDEALALTGNWNPHFGYGFFCRSSGDTIANFDELNTYSAIQLLKLHGSINWRPKLGHGTPIAIDSITHHHKWPKVIYPSSQIASELEPEPVMVPPVLSKSSLVEQPVLRLVWSRAFAELKKALAVTFVGYSFPMTDMAARTLFSEALADLSRHNINVVNLCQDESEAERTRQNYRSVLGKIPDDQFCFDGALEWIRTRLSLRTTPM